MEKITLLADAQRIEPSTIDFACFLAELTDSKLAGVLLQEPFYQNRPVAYNDSIKSNLLKPTGCEVLMNKEQASLLFMQEVRRHRIRGEVNIEEGSPESIGMYESRYADLLILEPDLSFIGYNSEMPSAFVRYILLKSECPVVLAPQSFNTISHIALCYDGSPSSIFAIKQFTYLFPQFRTMPILLLVIRPSTSNDKEEKYDRILGWLTAHYEKLEVRFLHGEVRDELFPFFINKKDTFIVMGAFGRNLISYLFRKSVSEMVIKTIDLPLFISHH